jgi:hypothetical protein
MMKHTYSVKQAVESGASRLKNRAGGRKPETVNLQIIVDNRARATVSTSIYSENVRLKEYTQ